MNDQAYNNKIKVQSENTYKQWAPQWREYAKFHSQFEMKDILDFQNIGIGKPCLVVATGYSFEENLHIIQKYAEKVDILCVDKSLGHLLRHGIKPKYCIVCDANVSYEQYLEPYKDMLSETILFQNVCANPKWSVNGNWKDKYFFINKDVLKSEDEFSALSGCKNFTIAGTNVSNAAIVLLTQCENQPRNFFGYDKILMTGFDYCWQDSYYAFNKDGGGKRNYMKALHLFNIDQEFCYSSTNLLFSAQWLERYIKAFNLPVIQTSKRSIVKGWKLLDLEEQLRYEYKPEDSQTVVNLLEYRRALDKQLKEINDKILNIAYDHRRSLMRTV